MIRGTLLAYRFMGKDRGGQGGTIVNTASTAFARPQVSTPIYTATNYAVVGLTRAYGVSEKNFILLMCLSTATITATKGVRTLLSII